MSKRRQNFENIAWFLDLYKRERLDMDPPFQRRSVWNQKYREDFIDTILLDYPAPAIFLFSSISDAGVTAFQLVDGKQRLETIFQFLDGHFTVSEKSSLTKFRGMYFETLPKDVKIAFYQYDFSVEYLPTNNEEVIDAIFERLNRNIAKLTAQELRHARFGGRFITAAENLQEWMTLKLGEKMPRIAESSRRQMKDVEVVAILLLFLETGVKGYSTIALDQAFSDREEDWENEKFIVGEFRETIERIVEVVNVGGQTIAQSRLRNQADFYSLFAAFAELARDGSVPDDPIVTVSRLQKFLEILEDQSSREASKAATAYYDAARSASNDPTPRQIRLEIVKRVIKGEIV
jgi:hypothetical protein